MTEENLESKLAEENPKSDLTKEDRKNLRSDLIRGTLFSFGALFLGAGGMFVAYTNIQHHDPLSYIMAGISAVSFTILAGLSYSLSCFYFTPPSERGDYGVKHPWMPEQLVDALQE